MVSGVLKVVKFTPLSPSGGESWERRPSTLLILNVLIRLIGSCYEVKKIVKYQ